MDRTFTLTGGACQPYPDGYYTSHRSFGSEKLSAKAEEAFTSAACKIAGGSWTGGHDLSGHTFMLTHASLFLWTELIPTLLDVRARFGPTRKNATMWNTEWWGVNWFVWTILGLWWWMLLMTSVYFHTWPEKVSGWFVALLEWGLLYNYLIPLNAQARQVFGNPTT